MNILFCYKNSLNPNKGGVGRVCDTLSNYLNSKANNVYYLIHTSDKKDTYKYPVETYYLPDEEFNANANLDYYHSLIKRLNIDILINHDASNDRSKFWLNTDGVNVKKISLHHADPTFGLNLKLQDTVGLRRIVFKFLPGIIRLIKRENCKKEIKFQLNNTDKLVVLSDEFINVIRKKIKLTSTKLVAINNPIELYNSNFPENKKKQIIYVGRLEWSQKRLDKLLHIWSCLYEKYIDWEMIILGDGPDRAKTETLAKDLNLKNITFKGFVNPEPYYKQASILCLTSDYEGFGLVMPEAMQYGVVPIAFNNWPSLKDIIDDGRTGVIVKTDQISDYAGKLDQLMLNEAMRRTIGLAAIEDVQKFHINKIGPQWDELLKSCMTND